MFASKVYLFRAVEGGEEALQRISSLTIMDLVRTSYNVEAQTAAILKVMKALTVKGL